MSDDAARSWRVPGMNPGVSTRTTSGMPNDSQVHELRPLLGGVRVDHAAEMARLVRHDADRAPLEASEAHDHVPRPAAPDLQKRPPSTMLWITSRTS